MIAQAKLLFSCALLLLVGAVSVAIWIVLTWHFSGQVDDLNTHVSLLQDQLKGVPVQINKDGRKVTIEEKKCLASSFTSSSIIPKAIVVTSFPDNESLNYAADFERVLYRINVKTVLLAASAEKFDDTGIMVGVKDKNNPSLEAQEFIKILHQCHFDPKIVVWGSDIKFPDPAFSTLDFDLFIGPVD